MYWSIVCERVGRVSEGEAAGRFVLHRHVDGDGAHLDLRLEQEGCLVGFRVESTGLEGEVFATEKAPHSLRWLEADGDAVREDAGGYCWLERDAEGGVLELRGERGARVLRVRREQVMPAAIVRGISECCRTLGVRAEDTPQLLRDGAAAREQALGRFCALGRELDGEAFEEGVWRRTLAGLPLEDIHHHLRAYEARFDLKYPPQPVSVAEKLPEEGKGDRNCQVMDIALG